MQREIRVQPVQNPKAATSLINKCRIHNKTQKYSALRKHAQNFIEFGKRLNK